MLFPSSYPAEDFQSAKLQPTESCSLSVAIWKERKEHVSKENYYHKLHHYMLQTAFVLANNTSMRCLEVFIHFRLLSDLLDTAGVMSYTLFFSQRYSVCVIKCFCYQSSCFCWWTLHKKQVWIHDLSLWIHLSIN